MRPPRLSGSLICKSKCIWFRGTTDHKKSMRAIWTAVTPSVIAQCFCLWNRNKAVPRLQNITWSASRGATILNIYHAPTLQWHSCSLLEYWQGEQEGKDFPGGVQCRQRPQLLTHSARLPHFMLRGILSPIITQSKSVSPKACPAIPPVLS